MEVKNRFENDPGDKARTFYFTVKGVFDGVSTLLEESKMELAELNENDSMDNTNIASLTDKIKRLEIQKEILGFTHKCAFDYQ